MKNIKFERYLIPSLVSVLLVSCMATTDNSEESISTPENEISSEQAIEVPNEELAPEENLNFVDNLNVEFFRTYPDSWASILSCKLFYEKDWLGSWTFHMEYDRALERRGEFRLLGINQAFDMAVVQNGVRNSRDEIRMIEGYCKDVLNYYSERDSRIPTPASDFWQTWDDN